MQKPSHIHHSVTPEMCVCHTSNVLSMHLNIGGMNATNTRWQTQVPESDAPRCCGHREMKQQVQTELALSASLFAVTNLLTVDAACLCTVDCIV